MSNKGIAHQSKEDKNEMLTHPRKHHYHTVLLEKMMIYFSNILSIGTKRAGKRRQNSGELTLYK